MHCYQTVCKIGKFDITKHNTEILRHLHVCSKAEQTEEDTEGRQWGAFSVFSAAARPQILTKFICILCSAQPLFLSVKFFGLVNFGLCQFYHPLNLVHLIKLMHIGQI
jgi:hypothetical protein